MTVSDEPIKDLKTNVEYFGDFLARQQAQRWSNVHCFKCAQCSLRVMCRFPWPCHVHDICLSHRFSNPMECQKDLWMSSGLVYANVVIGRHPTRLLGLQIWMIPKLDLFPRPTKRATASAPWSASEGRWRFVPCQTGGTPELRHGSD